MILVLIGAMLRKKNLSSPGQGKTKRLTETAHSLVLMLLNTCPSHGPSDDCFYNSNSWL